MVLPVNLTSCVKFAVASVKSCPIVGFVLGGWLGAVILWLTHLFLSLPLKGPWLPRASHNRWQHTAREGLYIDRSWAAPMRVKGPLGQLDRKKSFFSFRRMFVPVLVIWNPSDVLWISVWPLVFVREYPTCAIWRKLGLCPTQNGHPPARLLTGSSLSSSVYQSVSIMCFIRALQPL